jgi:methyl-accepting chemotaxis protein
MGKTTRCLVLLAILVITGGAGDDKQARENEALAVAELVADFIDTIAVDARKIADGALALRAAAQPRGDLRKMVEPILLGHDPYLGAAVLFEPDAYDGQDAAYRDQEPESDADGRLVPYFFRLDARQISIEPMRMQDWGVNDFWYRPTLQSKQPLLDEPFLYPVAGIDRLTLSVLVPMVKDDVALGVAGIDVVCDELIAAIRQRDEAWPGQVWVISAAGTWVYHPDATRVGHGIEAKGKHAAVAADELAAIDAYRRFDPTADAAGIDGPQAARIRFAGLAQEWTVIVSSQ